MKISEAPSIWKTFAIFQGYLKKKSDKHPRSFIPVSTPQPPALSSQALKITSALIGSFDKKRKAIVIKTNTLEWYG